MQLADEKLANYGEALHWYGEYLESFPTDADSPPINYQLADLLLENKDFGEAAKQYERTAYGYPAHAQSAAAGYAAVFAHREQLEVAGRRAARNAVKRDTVASSLKFADAFPQHEQRRRGSRRGRRRPVRDEGLPPRRRRRPSASSTPIRAPMRPSGAPPGSSLRTARSNWPSIREAEQAYAQVLAVTPEGDESRAALVDNLAASIYKQGERANEAQDYRAAADHFLRIRAAAPTSAIRPAAEYDAGAALIRLEDWTAAAERARGVPQRVPAARNAARGRPSRSPSSTARAASWRALPASTTASPSESKDPALRSEALLVAGDLYEQSNERDRALDVYVRYVEGVSAAGRDGRRDALQDRRDPQGSARRDALPPGAGGDRPRRRRLPGRNEPAARGHSRPARRWSSRRSSMASSSR